MQVNASLRDLLVPSRENYDGAPLRNWRWPLSAALAEESPSKVAEIWDPLGWQRQLVA